MGARVYSNREREIGWLPIHRTSDAMNHSFREVIPDQVDVFHWHGDTFDLPQGAVRLASSEACQNQAYAIGDRILAFQFHLEPFIQGAKSLSVECRDELIPSPYIQQPAQMLAKPERFDQINRMMDSVLLELRCDGSSHTMNFGRWDTRSISATIAQMIVFLDHRVSGVSG